MSARLRLEPDPTFANATARAITKNTAMTPIGTSGVGGALRLRFGMPPPSDRRAGCSVRRDRRRLWAKDAETNDNRCDDQRDAENRRLFKVALQGHEIFLNLSKPRPAGVCGRIYYFFHENLRIGGASGSARFDRSIPKGIISVNPFGDIRGRN